MLSRILIASLITLTAFGAQADWTIDSERSNLNFISVKNNSVGEVHQFNAFSGNLNDEGKLTINIDLNSVDTGIEIRDERMKEHLFNTEQFPSATLTADVDTGVMSGKTISHYPLKATLTVADNAVLLGADVTIQTLDERSLRVTSTKPVILSAKALGLVDGINKLREIAGLKSIDYVVPVTFDVVLTKDKTK